MEFFDGCLTPGLSIQVELADFKLSDLSPSASTCWCYRCAEPHLVSQCRPFSFVFPSSLELTSLPSPFSSNSFFDKIQSGDLNKNQNNRTIVFSVSKQQIAQLFIYFYRRYKTLLLSTVTDYTYTENFTLEQDNSTELTQISLVATHSKISWFSTIFF